MPPLANSLLHALRPMVVCAVGLFVLMATSVRSEDPSPEEDLRIQGRPLAEWRERMKGLDPNGPQAAGHVPVLIELIETESVPEFTRRQAALTLGRIGKPAIESVPVMRRILAATNSDSTRLWVLKAFTLLGETAGSASVDVARIVQDANQTHLIRVAGLEALSQMGPQQPRVMQTLLDGVRGALPSGNTHAERELQMAATEVLGLLGAGAVPAIPDLVRASEADWDLLRLSAVTTLGKIGPQGEIAIPALTDVILFDDAPEVRDAAAQALGAMGTSAIPTLTHLANEQDRAVRERALIGAISLGPTGTPILSSLMADADPELSIRAAEQLLSRPQHSQQAAAMLFHQLPTAPPRQQRTAFMALRRHPTTWTTDHVGFQRLKHASDPHLKQLAERLETARHTADRNDE